MFKALFSLVVAAVMWVQVPQWQPDWSQCSVDTPDVDCHWYVTAPDNTFGEGFSWENAPWFSAEGLLDWRSEQHHDDDSQPGPSSQLNVDRICCSKHTEAMAFQASTQPEKRQT